MPLWRPGTTGDVEDYVFLGGKIPSTPSSDVHCRVGSLEIMTIREKVLGFVHCRVGSLESTKRKSSWVWWVHCRVGSLENTISPSITSLAVLCRVGSLEIISKAIFELCVFVRVQAIQSELPFFAPLKRSTFHSFALRIGR